VSRVVTSLTNPAVKAVRALHARKDRETTGLFLAEGLKIVGEALESRRSPRTLMYAADAADHPLLRRAVDATERARGTVLEVTREVLAKVSRRDNPQTVIGVFEQRFTPLDELRPDAAACWVALEQVRDPGNLGTVIRTADAAGCGGVVLIGDCVDPYSVEAVRATMGSIFAVPVARATQEAFLVWRQSWPGSVVGARLQATTSHADAPYRRPTLIVMGAEQAGLSDAVADGCDLTVRIPMRGRADSLNLAVATGIMIYAVTGRFEP